jgi:VCBS repeat-containing protein
MDISRKQFVEAALGGSALLLFSSCGGGGYGGSNTVMPVSSCSPTIAANHGHVLTIAIADLDSPTAKTYDIMGTNTTHTHSVTFSAAQLAQLKAGTMVTVTSTAATTDGHTHSVAVSCVIYP